MIVMLNCSFKGKKGNTQYFLELLEVLLEEYKGKFPNLPVYVVSNLGFYEGMQTRHLFSIVENWCRRMGTVYGGGLVVGAGPMISTVKSMSLKTGLNKDIGNGLMKMASAIAAGETMENYYCKTGIPRFVYMKAAHMSFRKTLKENNVK